MSSKLPYGFGTIYTLSGKRRKPFIAKVSIRGQQMSLGTFSTYQEALDCLIEYHYKQSHCTEVFPLDVQASIKLSDAIKEFLNYKATVQVAGRFYSKQLIASYRAAAKYLKPIYQKNLTEITTLDIQKCVDLCPVGYNTRANIITLVSQVYKYAQKHQLCTRIDSPHKNVTIPVSRKHRDKNVFSAEDIKRLWIKHELKPVSFVLILIYTGMRISELKNLKISNIHIPERYMIAGSKTDAGINRIIPIRKEIIPIIESWISTGHELPFQIPYQYGENSVINKIYIALGISPKTPHEARHTFISFAKESGLDENCIKSVVGHKSTDITEYYTHRSIDYLIDQVDRIQFPEI